MLIFFTGVILTLRTNFFAVKKFKYAIKLFFLGKNQPKANNRLTPFQSSCAALSATMGTGNIVGVAGAICLGGPGAVFWMWVSAFFCMTVKFSEIVLAVRYRETQQSGSFVGGAMYYIKNALPQFLSPLGFVFCICGIAACFGMGNMAQINAISTNISALLNTAVTLSPKACFFVKLAVGIICAVFCGHILKNDVSIGRFCEKAAPLMTVLYICLTVGAIGVNITKVPYAFKNIFVAAFSPKSVTGGIVGSAFMGVRFGMSRGVFSNEAGLGTAPIAYACSDGNEIELGLMGVVEVFVDTIVVCTLTALTIICAGDIVYGDKNFTTLTLDALKNVYGKNIVFIFCPIVCIFAFSSAVGWALYGSKFICFLLNEKSTKIFYFLFVLAMIPFAVFNTEFVWLLAEIFNALMAVPNVTALLLLSNEVDDIIRLYKNKLQG